MLPAVRLPGSAKVAWQWEARSYLSSFTVQLLSPRNASLATGFCMKVDRVGSLLLLNALPAFMLVLRL